MRQWNKTGIFTVLLIGMVFLSGCAGPVSTGAAPVTPTVTQIVNETVPATPAPAPTTAVTLSAIPALAPASPVPQAATPAPRPATAVPTADGGGYNRSTNTDNNPPSTVSVEGVTGTLLIHVGGGSADGLTAYIARNGTNMPPFDSTYDPLRYVVEGQNPGYLHVRILPDGNSAIVNLMPGSYLAYLPDRSGSQPEEQSFMITSKYLTYVTFTGHAAGSSGGCGC